MATKIVKKFQSNGQEVIFRYPCMGDIDDILCNANALIEERSFVSLRGKQTKASERKWLSSLLRRIKAKTAMALAVEINGRVVGLANISKGEKEPFFHVGVFGISLSKEARGRGIGKDLLYAVVREARKALRINIVTLTVVGENKTAIRCYQSCGFETVGVIKGGINHYGKYLDYVYMVKYL